ncbi:MAG: D-alanyl-D-alanine carboxypeptidase family protein [Spirochaetales bacterium]|nr:D-alanyl-D-alanine carboxypeptidase family protein [Spirochaetales bacterium]
MRRRLLWYVLLAVLVPGAAWLFGVAVRGASQDQGTGGQGQMPEEGPEAQAAFLEALAVDLIERHPDFDLVEVRKLLEELRELPRRPREGRLSSLEAGLRAAESRLRRAAIGTEAAVEATDLAQPESDIEGYKTFSPNGFKSLYESVAGRGVTPLPRVPEITGDPEADRRIVELAVRRGYRLRGEADPERLEWEGRHGLQPEAFAAWRALRAAARSEGVELELISAYRSVERQRVIFLGALARAGAERAGAGGGGAPSARELASGQSDDLVNGILRESSPPGFSRHHTGFALDLTDAASGREFTDFGLTAGFAWISAGNYLNAKRFGFIPSYPAGAHGQGPDPEPWEYVWVGRELLERRSGSRPSSPGPSGPRDGGSPQDPQAR